MSLESKETVTCRKMCGCPCCNRTIFEEDLVVHVKWRDDDEGKFCDTYIHIVCDLLLELVKDKRKYEEITFRQILPQAERLGIIYLEGEVGDKNRNHLRWRWVEDDELVFEEAIK